MESVDREQTSQKVDPDLEFYMMDMEKIKLYTRYVWVNSTFARNTVPCQFL